MFPPSLALFSKYATYYINEFIKCYLELRNIIALKIKVTDKAPQGLVLGTPPPPLFHLTGKQLFLTY